MPKHKEVDDKIAIYFFLVGIRPGHAHKELTHRNPKSLGELLQMAEEFITKEDLDKTQRDRFARIDPDTRKPGNKNSERSGGQLKRKGPTQASSVSP